MALQLVDLLAAFICYHAYYYVTVYPPA